MLLPVHQLAALGPGQRYVDKFKRSCYESDWRGLKDVDHPHRKLVPFQPVSDLWPYPQPSADDRHGVVEEDGEIVELDFEDTSVLSDPAAFQKALQRGSNGGGQALVNAVTPTNGRPRGKARRKMEREAIERSWDVPRLPSQPDPPETREGGVLNPQTARATILATLPPSISSARLERNEFVRQVLTLIHVSSSASFDNGR
jgi:hypothetical protein